MSTQAADAAIGSGFGATARIDAWWAGPLATAVGLGGAGLYITFRIFYNADYLVDTSDSAHILSPFYSPLIVLPGMPAWFSPAFLILWMPGGFRLTCYYYRKAYYRSFLLDPPGCAVGEPRNQYAGETRLFLFQNLHRYFMYLALAFLFILSYDVILALIWPTEAGGHTFGMSLATIVLTANVVLLSFYTFSCHSFRHLIGGRLDCFSCAKFGEVRYKAWSLVSAMNGKHMLWAWCSLFMVCFADFYVWMVAAGHWTDLRFF